MVLALDHAHHHLHTGRHVQKEKAVRKGIAFFDFDGTITTKDTLLEFIKFSKGQLAFYTGFLFHFPWLLAMKLKLMPNQRVKEKILKHFFAGMNAVDFEAQCNEFYKKVLPSLIRPGAVAEIEKLKNAGAIVVVVSASPELWIQPWTKYMGVELIGSRLDVVNEKITGKIIGKNCYGAEKVERIKERYRLSDYETVYAYGDTSGDLPMLELAHQKFYKPFRNPVQQKEIA
jgi:phosphatidylglycerophosphatase C